MDFFISFTSYLGSFNTFVLWLIMLLICFLSILVFLKLFGYVGLYVYSALAVIIGNIQVLKTVDFFYSYCLSPNATGLYTLGNTKSVRVLNDPKVLIIGNNSESIESFLINN